jgi:hypothetical protein
MPTDPLCRLILEAESLVLAASDQVSARVPTNYWRFFVRLPSCTKQVRIIDAAQKGGVNFVPVISEVENPPAESETTIRPGPFGLIERTEVLFLNESGELDSRPDAYMAVSESGKTRIEIDLNLVGSFKIDFDR